MNRKRTAKQLQSERIELAIEFHNARAGCGLSLRELAQESELGLQTLVRIEAGGPGVGLANLQIALASVGLKLAVVPR